MKKSVILGCGGYLPENIVTNEDLAKRIDTNDEWISSRTGIKQRHIAASDEYTSHMATNAAEIAIKNANVEASEIDLIIVATTTPDRTFPSVGVNVQQRINANKAAAFDIQAVCSGFVYALSIADNFIKTGQAKTVLVIGADKMSSIVDWEDRKTCVLFGDGAGAVVVQASDEENRGILSTHLHSDGNFQDILLTDSGVSMNSDAGKLRMSGQDVFKHAVEKMSSAINEGLEANNLTKEIIDFLVPHQANSRIMTMIAKKMRLDESQVISTVALHANTSAASIPLALYNAWENKTINKQDLVVLTALGGGLTWGSCVLKW